MWRGYRFLRKWGKRLKHQLANLLMADEKIEKSQPAEAALRESEHRYRHLVELSPDAIVVHCNGRLVFVNSATVKLLGADSEETLLGRPIMDFIHSDSQKLVGQRIQHSLETGEKAPLIEEKFCRIDGSVIDVEVTAMPLTYQECPAMQVVIRDTTARKYAGNILRESEERYRAFSELLSDFAYVMQVSPDGSFADEWVSESFTHVTGYSIEEARRLKWTGILHPDDFPWVVERLSTILAGDSFKAELRIVTKDRQVKWLIVYSHPVWDDTQKRVCKVYGAAQDITQQKHAEYALRESEARARSLINALPDMMFRVNREGVILDYKAERTELYVQTEDILIGRTLGEFLPPDLIKQTQHATQAALNTGQMQVFEYQLPMPGDQLRDYEARMVACTGDDVAATSGDVAATSGDVAATSGDVAATSGDVAETRGEVVVIVRDITERKQAEIALHEAREEAEKANRAKDLFLASISHELRTPLNAILGYTQLLSRNTILPTKVRDELATIRRSGEHLLTMINEILDFSKVEAEKMELDIGELSFSDFLQSLCDMVQVQADQKGISFIVDLDPNLPKVLLGDEQRLRQILLNLLQNAVKFTDVGTVIFRVQRLTPSSGQIPTGTTSKTARLCFHVEDQGVGIPPEDISHIFQPFQQIGEKRFFSQGVGLGLAISQRFVAMMGGELQVTSTPGQGSTFWFELTFPEGERATSPRVEVLQPIIGVRRIRKDAVEPAEEHSLRVLVVDDNDENRDMLRHILEPAGFDILEAAHGQEALECMRNVHPDLVFMDLMMPVLDGIETTRRIRQHTENDDTVIIGISANVADDVRQQCFEAGCEAFIEKPFDIMTVFHTIQQCLAVEWVYGDNDAESSFPIERKRGDLSSLRSGLPQFSASMWSPPAEVIENLYETAICGDIVSLRELIQRLVKNGQQRTPFVERLELLIKSYRMNEIAHFLEGYREHEGITLP
jgi:PAS domain S-box-containing protein